MHKCIVCFNMYKDTKVNRPEVIYHGFPKNAYMRRKWLKVFGIDRCHDWQRVCSDHFLDKDYRPGKKRFLRSNTIPQPYDRNGFRSNYAIQSNDVETGNDIILPMEQNITRNLDYYDESDCIESEFYREEHIGNAVVNSFKSPKRSYRFTGNNVVMRSRQMPDHTLGSGLQCSVKNCMNRLSKNLSLFGYPKDIRLRKLWMRKCGIKTDATKIALSSTRVCSIHFIPGCFKNPELKNRLKRGSVPSLFLDNEPRALPVPIIEVPVLRTCDTFISPIVNEAAEQSSSEIKNNVKDNTDNTSMAIDLTIDDSSNSSLSITLEPIEERTSQCIMDVCKTNNNTRNEQGLIYKISRTTGNISTPSTIIGTVQTDNNVSEEDSFVQINDSLDNINTTTPEHISTPEPTSSSEPKNKKPKITTFQQSLLEVMKNPPMIKSNNDEFDPDKAFLLSFLPDFKKMNDSQKLDFKILFTQSVRHILNPSSDYPQYSNIQQFNYPNNFYSPNSHTPSLNQFPVQSFHPSVTQTVHTPSSHSQPPPSSFSPTDYEDIGMHHSV